MDSGTFLGKGWKFPPGFEKNTGKTLMVADEEDVFQSLEILIGTIPGERLMQPAFGTALSQFLFKPMGSELATMIKGTLTDNLIRYEPRIAVNQIEVDLNRMIDGMILVMIDFTIRQINARHNIVYPFYYQEGNLIPGRLINS